MDIDQIIAIFPDLTNPDIEEIKVFATKKQCESGELIFSEGDEARSLLYYRERPCIGHLR